MNGKKMGKSVLCAVLVTALLGAGCGKEQSAPEVYLDESIPETPVKLFTQNETVSVAIEECLSLIHI